MDDAENKSSYEKAPTAPELARSWLEFRRGEVQKAIDRDRDTLKWTRNYKMAPPGPRPDSEAGGMDISDWQISNMESQQWPEEQQEEVERLEQEVENHEEQLDTIGEQEDLVAKGDPSSVTKFAKMEADRRAKIEEERVKREKQKKEKEESLRGIELLGSHELLQDIEEIINTVASGRVPNFKRGSNGWQLDFHNKADQWNPNDSFVFDCVSDPNQKSKEVTARFVVNDDGFWVNFEDFRNAEPAQSIYGAKTKAERGRGLNFKIGKDNLVSGRSVSGVIRDWQWGYPDYHNDSTGIKGQFSQTDFDIAKDLIHKLSLDIQGLHE